MILRPKEKIVIGAILKNIILEQNSHQCLLKLKETPVTAAIFLLNNGPFLVFFQRATPL